MLFDENFRNKEYLDYKTLGDLAMEIGEYDKAISHYKKQLKIMSEPDYDYDEVFDLDSIEGTYLEYELYEQIARAYECENDYNNAIKYVKLMIKDDENRDVNKGDSLIKLSKLYILDNNKEEGIKILDDLLKYELDLMKKEYKESKFKFFGSRYQKSLYIEVCYELAELLKEDNRNQSMHYINLALDIYNKHKKNDLGNEISSILKLQTKFYKEDIESSLKSSETQPDIISKQNIEKAKSICKNSLLESKIYMEAYVYFDFANEDTKVFHMMGKPDETKHLVVAEEQAVISPSWSIHSGVGTSNYSFIWAMCGENITYTDMDMVPMDELK